MSTEDVDIVITQDSVGVVGPGQDIPLILSCNAAWAERYRQYSSLGAGAVDFPVTTSPEYLALQRMFAQNPKPPIVAVGRCALKPTQRYLIEASTVRTNHKYKGQVDGQGVTSTAIEVATFTNMTFTANAATEECTTASAHGLSTGDGPFHLTTSAADLPLNLTINTDYWIIKVSATVFKLATTKALALAGTAVDIGDAGTGTHTINTATNDSIARGLVDRLNAVVGKNYTAVLLGAADTYDVQVTADAAGNWFSLQIKSVDDLKIAQNHVDPGVATDLAAIVTENNQWYGLISLYNSKALVGAVAAWAESNKKLYFPDVNESDICTVAVASSDDTAEDLFDLAYKYSAVEYHSKPAAMFAAGWMGRYLSTEPGRATAKFKTIAGVEPETLTDTHRANIKARKANSYERRFGVSITFEGWTASGQFIDITRNDDWVRSDMAKAIFGTLAANDVVPFTDPGILLIVNDVRGSLQRAVDKGIYASFDVEVPKASAVSTENKQNRILPDIRWSAVRAGAIHSVKPVTGVISL